VSFSPSSPVTGAAQAGLTSPTYTLTLDTATDVNARQYAVTALGGTQTGVLTHSMAQPFTTAFYRPKITKTLGLVDPVTGVLRQVPLNTFGWTTRKGVIVLAGQAPKVFVIKTIIEEPAGSDLADPLSIRAALSLHFGAGWANSSAVGDTVITGIM
jgi:hypothetical protein